MIEADFFMSHHFNENRLETECHKFLGLNLSGMKKETRERRSKADKGSYSLSVDKRITLEILVVFRQHKFY